MHKKNDYYCCFVSLAVSVTKGLSLTGLEPGNEMGLE
jgi:hypothetical protein